MNSYSQLRSLSLHRRLWRRLAFLTLAIPGAIFILAPANASDGQYIANSTPAFVATTKSLGATDPSMTINVAVWLNLHNHDQLDALAQELYDPTSSEYRHWLKSAEVAARFAPTAAEAQIIKAYLESKDLTVSSIGSNNFYVKATGTIAQVEKAFAVQINNYTVAGKTVRSNSADPYVEGTVSALIQSISGLDDNTFQSMGAVRSTIVSSSAPAGQLATAVTASAPSGFQSQCFPGTATVHATTLGGYPKATYTGNQYIGTGGGCGYSPANIRAAYNLNALYAEGYDGKGQTIVFVESCGTPTLLNDVNTFSASFGLPKLTPANFNIISMGPSTCAGVQENIQADVEWAHAVAPGAALAVIFTVSNDPEDADEAMLFALDNGLGNTIADDNGMSETLLPEAEVIKEGNISEMAAVQGIAANYPGGVGSELSFGSPVMAPANGPYGTGIGGTSLALAADGSIAFQTAWEDHLSEVESTGAIFDPAIIPSSVIGGYIFGGRGGKSAFFAKPSFQKTAVSGTQRGVPDFSWVGDPYTGLITVATTYSQEPPQTWFASGGTNVSTSMFSALWAIANQKAGVALGQAAPYLYSLPAGAVTDIVPYSSPNDVVATVQETSASSTRFNAAQTLLLGGLEKMFGPFYTALWENPDGDQNTALVLSFGEDFEMKAAVGWDEVTGMGAPLDAQAFVNWVGGNNP